MACILSWQRAPRIGLYPRMSPENKHHARSSLHISALAALAPMLLPSLAAADTHVTATGQFVVFDNGAWQPLRNARIKLMDSDFDADDVIATSQTDANGNFVLDGFGGDSGSNSIKKPDIYVKIWLVHNGLTDVEDEVGYTHTCHTGVLEEFSGSHNFGTIHCTEATPSILFFRSMFERTWFTNQTGDSFPDGEIDVHFPNWVQTGNYTFYETLHINGVSSFFHEVGHRLRDALDGDLIHWNWDNTSFIYLHPGHDDFTVASTQGFAFHEGFAQYHKTNFDSNLLDHYRNWTPISGGEFNEANVAHALVLLAERTCNDGNPVGFNRIYQTLKQNPGIIHSLHQLQDSFAALFPECPENGKSQGTIVAGTFVDVLDWTAGDYLKWIDTNSAAEWNRSVPRWLPREAMHVFTMSEDERHHWDTTARDTYRSIVSDQSRYFEQWFLNESLPDQQLKMRERLVTTVGRQRIADLTAIRSTLARDIASTPAGPLHDFYVNLDVRYQRTISSLQAAVAAPTTGEFPEGILSSSFSSSVAAAR
jgi:transthyretin-like family protein